MHERASPRDGTESDAPADKLLPVRAVSPGELGAGYGVLG